MAQPLRLVIVSFVDDNFGDILIRISFQGLLEVALANHGLAPDDYEIVPMPLKKVDEELLGSAHAILFAGGGLFGLSYLDFFTHLDQITAIADNRGIPVVFSSMGLNNMDAADSNVDAIAEVVRRRCVKAVAVRENLALFQDLVTDLPFEARQIADPAVWTKYVYGMTDTVPDGTLGVNVVRGGLFVANKRDWGLAAEMEYLAELSAHAEAAGMSAHFYTNGSLDDNNSLRFFAQENAIQPHRVILPQTTREVVDAIASRSAIASIRMHSSIIAYSFGIPTVALEWNDKLPHFYEAIGHPERVIPFGEWSGERSFEALRAAGVAPEDNPGYQSYLMSTYAYIHEVVGRHVLGDDHPSAPAHDFAGVAEALVTRANLINEDENDLRIKMGKAERAYLRRFITIRAKDSTIRELRAKTAALTKQVKALEEQTRRQQSELDMGLGARLARRVRRRGGRVLRRLGLR